MLAPTERMLIRDFEDYLTAHHPDLNPFDHSEICRGDLNRPNRRCEAILREIEPTEAWHRQTAVIEVECSAFKLVWPNANKDTRQWHISLYLAPGDTMSQARSFWSRVDSESLLRLQEDQRWPLWPNLHFSYISTHLYGAKTTMPTDEYVEFWKRGGMEVQTLKADGSGSFQHHWQPFLETGLISQSDVEGLEQETSHTKRQQVYMSPRLHINLSWLAEEAEELDRDGVFKREVMRYVREATETWREVPECCSET